MRNEVEINAVGGVSVREQRAARARGRRTRRAATRRRGEQIVQDDRLPGLPRRSTRRRAREAGPRRTFGQPLAEHRQQDDLRVDLQLGARSEALQPGDLHARPAADRRAGGRRRDVSVDAEAGRRATRRRPRPTRRRSTRSCSTTSRAVMPFEEAQGGGREAGRRRRSSSSSGGASSAATAASAATTSRASRTTQPIGTELSEEGSKLVTRLDFAFVTTSRTPRSSPGSGPSCTTRGSSTRGACCSRSRSCGCRTSTSAEEEVERLLTAIMSFQREIQPAAAMPAKIGAPRLHDAAGGTLVHRRNCVGCHIIEGDGGDFLKLVAEPSLGPPMLTPEGARVQPDWLYAFLRGPITIRPWLNVRMPTFGLDDQNLNGVDPVLRRGVEQHGAVPDARDRARVDAARRLGQGAVRAAEVPAVPRARRDSEGSADVEPRAGSAHGDASGCSRNGFSTG